MATRSGFLQSSLVAVICGLVFLHAPDVFAGDGVSPYLGIYGGMAFNPSLENVEGRTS